MLVGFLGTLFLVGCTHDPRPTPSAIQEIQELRRRTVPNSGQLVRITEPVQDGFSVRAEWEVQAGLSGKQAYFQWLKDQLGPEYRVTAETPSSLMFAKQMDGDSYDLEISVKPSPSGIVAEAKFVALPD